MKNCTCVSGVLGRLVDGISTVICMQVHYCEFIMTYSNFAIHVVNTYDSLLLYMILPHYIHVDVTCGSLQQKG